MRQPRKRLPTVAVLLFPAVLCLFLSACPAWEREYDVGWEEALSFFDWLHADEMELAYDGEAAGTWGEGMAGTRLPLRNVYWRVEAYGRLARTTHPDAALFAQREASGIAYLRRVQGANGCWGIPADPEMPEFGSTIQDVIDLDADSGTYIVDGWILNLPAEKLSELYYDHGRALTALCRHYLRDEMAHGDDLGCIVSGADWAAAAPASADHNVNYDASLVEGLALAYLATGEESYRASALSLAQAAILPFRNADGSFGDTHNGLLRYHGFILSGLVALASVLPVGDERVEVLDHIATARAYLEENLHTWEQAYDDDCVGISSRVYAELQDLAATGRTAPLSDGELSRLNFLRMKCVESKEELFGSASLSAYARIKAQWHFCQLGVAIAAFHFDG